MPDLYRPEDPAWVLELIRAHPLAALVTAVNGEPIASHVPVITGTAGEPGRAVTGVSELALVGHMNRANPQWTALRTGTPALLIFSGPDAYISPTAYGPGPAAPTWNFAAVHVRGTVDPVAEPALILGVIKATVAAFEARNGTAWDMTGSLGYFDKLLPGVGAFEMRVRDVESMFKLSQEKEPSMRLRVADALSRQAGTTTGRLVSMMARVGGNQTRA